MLTQNQPHFEPNLIRYGFASQWEHFHFLGSGELGPCLEFRGKIWGKETKQNGKV